MKRKDSLLDATRPDSHKINSQYLAILIIYNLKKVTWSYRLYALKNISSSMKTKRNRS